MSRKTARDRAFKLVFEYIFTKEIDDELMEEYLSESDADERLDDRAIEDEKNTCAMSILALRISLSIFLTKLKSCQSALNRIEFLRLTLQFCW